MGSVSREQPLVRIRPRRSLIRVGTASFVVLLIPLTLAFVFAVHNGHGMTLAIEGDLAIAAVALAVLLRQLLVHVEATPSFLRGNGIFSPMVQVPRTRIIAVHRVALARVGRDPARQTLFVDRDGVTVFRMRDYFWDDDDLDRLTAVIDPACDRPVLRVDQVELDARFPGARYWFERSVITAIGMVALAAASALGIGLFLVLEH